MSRFKTAARKAVATFLFATLGVVAGFNVMDVDVATWQVALGTGLGAVLNLVYRWSEAVVRERPLWDAGAVGEQERP
jgi:hypothetical protein